MFYSKSTGGFYTREIHGDNIPADAVEITVEGHQALLEGQSQGKRIVADENGYPVLQDPPPQPADQRRKAAKDAIDAAAGKARDAFVSPGQYVAEEYRLAKQQADEWVAAGKPADAVPPAVEVWAQARGWTAEQAATDILQTEQLWTSMLLAIREQRLLGKGAVDAADDNADFDAVAAPYIAALEAIREQAPS